VAAEQLVHHRHSTLSHAGNQFPLIALSAHLPGAAAYLGV
jgi:hypothetical protein